jgi:hypothetical protein
MIWPTLGRHLWIGLLFRRLAIEGNEESADADVDSLKAWT